MATPSSHKYESPDKALKALKLFLAQEDTSFMEDEILGIIKQYPQFTPLLPPALLKKAQPDKPITKTEDIPAELRMDYFLNKIITQHPLMLELKHKVKILASLQEPVLITGETGTGKELIARALHGKREPNRFVDLNCAGMPEYLIESELFGHSAGSFTGAHKDKVGLMEEANNGTLFLDEFGELPLVMQAKLLRALQEMKIRRIGSNRNIAINCRIVCATHHNLKEDCKNRFFRDDLYARIKRFELRTIPLKERMDDIPAIISNLDSEGDFPQEKVEWEKVDLTHNYRELQDIVARWKVLKELPKI